MSFNKDLPTLWNKFQKTNCQVLILFIRNIKPHFYKCTAYSQSYSEWRLLKTDRISHPEVSVKVCLLKILDIS